MTRTSTCTSTPYVCRSSRQTHSRRETAIDRSGGRVILVYLPFVRFVVYFPVFTFFIFSFSHRYDMIFQFLSTFPTCWFISKSTPAAPASHLLITAPDSTAHQHCQQHHKDLDRPRPRPEHRSRPLSLLLLCFLVLLLLKVHRVSPRPSQNYAVYCHVRSRAESLWLTGQLAVSLGQP